MPDALTISMLRHNIEITNLIKVILKSHTSVAVFSFETIRANTSVAFSCEAYLADEVLSRAWFTETNVRLENIKNT